MQSIRLDSLYSIGPRRLLIDGRRYLTNIHRERYDIVAEAIVGSGRHDIHISEDTIPGTPHDREYFSVWVETDCDCSDFWLVYEQLLREPRWNVYLAMLRS